MQEQPSSWESLSAARLKEVRINGFMDWFHTGKVGIDFVNQQLSSLLGPSVHEVKWTSLNCRRQVVSYPAYGAHFNKICIAHDKCTQTSWQDLQLAFTNELHAWLLHTRPLGVKLEKRVGHYLSRVELNIIFACSSLIWLTGGYIFYKSSFSSLKIYSLWMLTVGLCLTEKDASRVEFNSLIALPSSN